MVTQQNLTTLARYQAYQSGQISTAQQALISQLIGAASRTMLGSLNRGSLVSQIYTDRYTPPGGVDNRIMLRRYPVTNLISFSLGQCSIPIATPPGPGQSYPRGALLEPADPYPPGKPQSVDVYCYPLGLAGGPQGCVATYQAGYLVQDEAYTVPSITPPAYTPMQPYGPWAADNGVTYAATGVALTPVASAPLIGQYVPPAPWAASPTTAYQFSGADNGAALDIDYSFIPSDLEQGCIAWIAERVAYSGRIGVRSQSLLQMETFSYFLGDVPAYVESILQDYRMEVPIQ